MFRQYPVPTGLACMYNDAKKVPLHSNSVGASIERYNNEAWHEDHFKIIFKIPFYSVN